MTHEITTGAILIKDNALLPKELQFESETCVPGWRLVKGFDGYELDREIQKEGWHFFCLAGEIKATVFGMDEQHMVHRAIERILANSKSEKFNSLEITRVASVGSQRFPLVHYVTVSASSRHIQESMVLFSIEDSRRPGPNRDECRPNPDMGLASRNVRLQETLSQPNLSALSTP
jgi:hypothetical protein